MILDDGLAGVCDQSLQRQDQQKQDQGGKKQGFDKDQMPQQGGQTDRGQRQ